MAETDKKEKMGNPYAFPQTNDNNEMHDDYNGMMLRDYFAAKAMSAIMSRENFIFDDVPVDSYEMADAMLKERLKKDSSTD